MKEILDRKGNILFAVEEDMSALQLVEKAVSAKISLYNANLNGADLSGANLIRVNLNGADLRSANLYRVNLNGADLYSANLISANLSGANLFRVNLISANLSGANLFRVNLVSANLNGANLSGANLFRVNLISADLSGADLSGATIGCVVVSDEFDWMMGYHHYHWWSVNTTDGRVLTYGCEGPHTLEYWLEHNEEIAQKHNDDKTETIRRLIAYLS